MDPYEGLAERYNLSFGLFGEHDPQVVEFFRRLFAQNIVHTVLDCACGTGRHLPLFHSLGCEVTGSDVSESMLARARNKLAGIGLDISLFQVDFRNLPVHFQQSFDAVVCLAAIGFMSSETEFLKAFECMGQVLRAGGILILTPLPTDRRWGERLRFILPTNTPHFSRLFAIDYLERKVRYNILDIFHADERRDLQIWSAELCPLLMDDQQRLLKIAGFSELDFLGAFDCAPYDKETSNSLITVAYR
ncbi:MAG TPA: class I SAM-dependent methyltransferase [Anaerolineales bacterium]|nr:class I SAM-dependent methyltransferase [Anaerolineales bacterium]